MCEEDFLPSILCEVRIEELIETDRLRWARARLAATVSGDGGSTKMKNFMKAPISITIES